MSRCTVIRTFGHYGCPRGFHDISHFGNIQRRFSDHSISISDTQLEKVFLPPGTCFFEAEFS